MNDDACGIACASTITIAAVAPALDHATGTSPDIDQLTTPIDVGCVNVMSPGNVTIPARSVTTSPVSSSPEERPTVAPARNGMQSGIGTTGVTVAPAAGQSDRTL